MNMAHIKQLLDEVFLISGIIKVEVSVISRSRRLRLITLTMYNNGFNLFLARAVFLVYRTFKGNGRRKVPMLLLKTHRQQFFRV